MKYKSSKICVILIVCSLSILAQTNTSSFKYFVLERDKLPESVTVTKVLLNAQQLYGNDVNIELYNLLDKHALILLSVLPDLASPNSAWTAIDLASVKSQILSYSELKDLMNVSLGQYTKSNGRSIAAVKRDDLKLIIKKDGQYRAANFCLVEFFKVYDHHFIFPNENPLNVINTMSPAYSSQQFEQSYREVYHQPSPNAANEDTPVQFDEVDKPLLFRSPSTGIIAGEKVYKFWALNQWAVMDGLNVQRGIDRFLYIPGKGIVGGSFDFWFQRNCKNLMNNYLKELIMHPVKINEKEL